MKNVSAILTADWHIREDTPVCRDEGEYFAAQANKIGFIKDLQKKYACPILTAGDIFNHWKPSPFLLSWCLQQVPGAMYCVYGQHDLPQHNKLLFQKTGLHVLDTAHLRMCVIDDSLVQRFDTFQVQGFWYGSELEGIEGSTDFSEVALCHTFTWRGRRPWPGCAAPGAASLLRKMKGFDLVVTGDNHKAFTLAQDGQLLVNPGSLMRMSADQADFRPRVYLWDAETNTVKPVYLPIEKGAVKRGHLEKAQDRDERIESFVKKLAGKWKAGMSFEENVKRFLEENEVPESVKKIILEAMDEDH